jgi:hypothetical protein
MHRKGLSGIGVTETEGGPLIGNLSMSDLRGLTPDRQSLAFAPAHLLKQCYSIACM